jgi:5S rRNA maturation endonuclease (ribonuclease M5)
MGAAVPVPQVHQEEAAEGGAVSVRAAELVERLDGVRAIQGGWTARCPAHEDTRQSLSVSEGEDGRVLLKCHAGCEFADIVRALDLAPKDLFPPSSAPPRRQRPGPASTPASPPLSDDHVQAWRAALRDDPAAWKHVTEVLRFSPDAIEHASLGLKVDGRGRRWLMYPYRRGGAWTYAKGRSIDGEKAFVREPAGQASHPYLAGELEEDGTAIVVEGERDAVAAWTLSLHTEIGGTAGSGIVSLPDGAKPQAPKAIVDALANQRLVYLFTDADGPGDAAAKGLAEALGGDRCRRVRLKEHKDLGDVLAQLGPEMGADAALQAFRDADDKGDDPTGARALIRSSMRRFTVAQLADAPPPLEYILHPYIPKRKVVTLAGPGGSNKTTLLTYLAVCRALGLEFHGGSVPTRGKTAILTAEDGIEDYWRRLAALRHDLGDQFDAAAIADAIVVFDLAGEQVRLIEQDRGMFSISPFVDHFAKVLRAEAKGADLVICETVSRLTGGIETNESLSVLVNAAEHVCKLADVTMLLVAHVSQEAGREGLADQYSARGGSALGDNGRSSLVLTALNEKNKKLYLPDADISLHEMRDLLLFRHPKSIGPKADDMLFRRVSTPHGPVLHRAVIRSKNENRAVLRAKVVDLVQKLTSGGITVTSNVIETTYAADLGCSQRETRKLIHEALKGGQLAEQRNRGRRGTILVATSEAGYPAAASGAAEGAEQLEMPVPDSAGQPTAAGLAGLPDRSRNIATSQAKSCPAVISEKLSGSTTTSEQESRSRTP